MTAYVELYNADRKELLKRVSVEKAFNMLWRGVASVLEEVPGETFGLFPRPKAISLVRYIFAKWKYERERDVAPTRRGILRRDNNRCAYCGRDDASTIDHIHPRSRGGEDTWLNLVASCQKCNNIKDDKPLKEARFPDGRQMKLLFEPRVPKFSEVYSWGRP